MVPDLCNMSSRRKSEGHMEINTISFYRHLHRLRGVEHSRQRDKQGSGHQQVLARKTTVYKKIELQVLDRLQICPC